MQLRAWSIMLGVAIVAAVGVFFAVRREEAKKKDAVVVPDAVARAKEIDVPKVHFRDVTADAGIRFTHTNGAFGKKLLPETLGSGIAVLDFDKDGHPDLFFVNSRNWPGTDEATHPPLPHRNKGRNLRGCGRNVRTRCPDVRQLGVMSAISTTTVVRLD
ncbi:MAG: hypothetical protein U0744_16930 [Gemmataceae bacterium]